MLSNGANRSSEPLEYRTQTAFSYDYIQLIPLTLQSVVLVHLARHQYELETTAGEQSDGLTNHHREPIPMPNALVTGVAGFIGSNLAEELLERGYEVRGVDDFSTGKQRNLQPLRSAEDFTFHEGDVRDSQLMDDVTTNVDYVFHQAAIASVPKSIEDPVTTTDVNCGGTASVLQAANDNDVETVVVASSAAVYGSGGELPKVESMEPIPESPYASSKLYSEQLAMQFDEYHDIDTMALRYFNVYGPRQDIESDYAAVIPIFINRMLSDKRPIIFGDGTQTRDFAYVHTVVEANIRAARAGVSGEIINVGTGTEVSVNELVENINGILETNLDPKYEDPRPGDVKHSYANVSKLKDLLNLEREVELRKGLEQTVKYYQAQNPSSGE